MSTENSSPAEGGRFVQINLEFETGDRAIRLRVLRAGDEVSQARPVSYLRGRCIVNANVQDGDTIQVVSAEQPETIEVIFDHWRRTRRGVVGDTPDRAVAPVTRAEMLEALSRLDAHMRAHLEACLRRAGCL